MPSVQIRPFRRSDRDQLTDLVNAHAGAVVPGMGTSVAALLASLDRDPGEPVTNPWVGERATLVAEQQHRVVAAAHLLRYLDDERVGESFRGMPRSGLFAGRASNSAAIFALNSLVNVRLFGRSGLPLVT